MRTPKVWGSSACLLDCVCVCHFVQQALHFFPACVHCRKGLERSGLMLCFCMHQVRLNLEGSMQPVYVLR